MIDAVLTHPHSPLTCGVAKFSYQLANRLGVPCLPFTCLPFHTWTPFPLLSIKGSDYNGEPYRVPDAFDLFAHDYSGIVVDLVPLARKVYAGDGVIADKIRVVRPDVVTAWCPSTVNGNAGRGAYRVLVFGMAHKLLLPHFKRLKQQLDIEHPDYTIELSTAVHEGSPWDHALTESVQAMRGIFGHKLRVLGYLGDDALAKELQECHAVAAYYTPALRANNTTAWAALEAGKTLYTNTDEFSPPLDPTLHSWEMLCALLKGAA